ncbi:MAG: outer membrane lipoprotein-sorting protein, partial [Magnetococcales bacterium]|nr:outer membrane lipoprotein-sorting protein [Magnetococcales bacterium]
MSGLATAATESGLSGRAIMERVTANNFHPYEYELLTITRTNADGSRVVRNARRYSRQEQGEGATNQYLLVFDSPKPIQGVAFLIRMLPGGIQGHWVYLPALNSRMLRVIGGGGTGIFDTDFSVEDLASEDLARFIYQRKADLMYKKRPHFLVEARPKEQKRRWPSYYGLRQIYIDQELSHISRVDYFDKNGQLIKQRSNLNSNIYKTAKLNWQPETVLMESSQKGTKTAITTNSRILKESLVPEEIFSQQKIVNGILMRQNQWNFKVTQPKNTPVAEVETAIAPKPQPSSKAETAIAPKPQPSSKAETAIAPKPQPAIKAETAIAPKPQPSSKAETAIAPKPRSTS